MAFDRAAEVVGALATLRFAPELPAGEWSPAAGVRLRRHREPVRLDLFFSLDDRYDEIARHSRTFPFGPGRRRLPFLCAEDLAVFKLSFGRDKDWVDLRHLVEAQPVDLAYFEDQLIAPAGTAHVSPAGPLAQHRQAGGGAAMTHRRRGSRLLGRVATRRWRLDDGLGVLRRPSSALHIGLIDDG